MKRIAIAGAGCLLTFGLAIFAVALAQRDSREREGLLDSVDPDYAHQAPEPIALSVAKTELPGSPVSFHQDIVEPVMQTMPDEEIAPLNQPPITDWPNDELIDSAIMDDSEMVLAAGQTPLPASDSSLVAPPGLLSAPSSSMVPAQSHPRPAGENIQNLPPPSASLSPPSSMPSPPSAMLSPPAFDTAQAPTAYPPPPPPMAPAIDSIPAPPASIASPMAPSMAPPTARLESASNPFSSMPRLAQLASPAPGTRQMDGAQNPSLQIQKRAPEEVQVGQPATFALLVRNVGNATAYEVSVVDSIPRGTRLSKTSPTAEHRPDGTLIWSLGEMKAGSEQVLTVELIPESEGEIGSVASVNFAAQASVRTVSTQPKLTIKQVAESTVLLGKSTRIQVIVSNEGTGVARGVSLEEDVPSGLKHPLGATLGVPMGDLVPGQSRSTELELTATAPGLVRNLMRAVAANTSGSDSTVDIQIVAPQLKVSIVGPSLRYLERQATYQLSVTNQGTSTAYDVEIVANLPRGLQYNSSGNHGEYHSSQHAVSWGLEELGVGTTATTDLVLLPVEEGDFAIRLQSQAIGVQSEPFEKQVRIEGQSELAFSIDDENDPIEIDGQTTYAVTVTNNGTRVDEDVQVMIELPKGARVLQVNGPVGFKESAQGLLFEPISRMRAKDRQVFRFSVQHTQSGVHVVRAQLKSKLRPVAIVNEESTEVYRDQ